MADGNFSLNNISIPVKSAVATFIIVGGWYLAAQNKLDQRFDDSAKETKAVEVKLNEIIVAQERRIEIAETQLAALIAQFDLAYNDRFTLTMMSEYALRDAIANPGKSIPDPRDPHKNIIVRLPNSP